MHKRILILVTLLMIIFSTSCFASEQQDQQQVYIDALDVYGLYNDCIYLYKTSGLSYNQFSDMYTKATLEKNRFINKNKDIPNDLLEALNNIDSAFSDTRDMWKASIYNKNISKNEYTEYLRDKYPRLKEVKLQKFWGLYDTGQMANILAGYCIEYNLKLKEAIDNEGKAKEQGKTKFSFDFKRES